jgi:hypothetical protein
MDEQPQNFATEIIKQLGFVKRISGKNIWSLNSW